MGSSIGTLIGSISTVLLIVLATRWLISAKGADLPRTRKGVDIYGIKLQWRVVALANIVLWVVILIGASHNFHSDPGSVLIGIAVLFILGGSWLAYESVNTAEVGISKRGLWGSRTFRWTEITEIRIHARDGGGAIELRKGSQRIVIDSRFVAYDHLLSEITERTELQLTRMN